MHIIRYGAAKIKQFPNGEFRRYYCPSRDPLEIIETIMQPRDSQSPHAHEMVREATLVLEGKIIVAEIVGGERKEEYELQAGDFVVFDPRSCHTMENRSDTQAHTLTFKFLGEQKDEKLFFTDKLVNCTDPAKLKTINTHDPRYAPYVKIYNNLDKLLWQVPAFLVAVSALGFGLLGNFITKSETVIPPLTSHDVSVGLVFVLMGVLYLVGVFSMSRIRKHHTLMGNKLKNLEPIDGYFHEREAIVEKEWYKSATLAIRVLFFILGLVSLGVGFYLIKPALF